MARARAGAVNVAGGGRGHGHVRALRRERAARRVEGRGRSHGVRGQPALRAGAMSARADTPLRRIALSVAATDTTWRTLAVLCIYRVLLAVLIGTAAMLFTQFF